MRHLHEQNVPSNPPKMRRTYTKSMLIDPVVKKPEAIKTNRFAMPSMFKYLLNDLFAMRSRVRGSTIHSYLFKQSWSRLLGTISLREGTKYDTVARAVS